MNSEASASDRLSNGMRDSSCDRATRIPQSPGLSISVETPHFRHIQSNDADEYGERVRNDWKARLTQLQPGPFEASVKLISLERVSVVSSYLNKSLVLHNTTPSGVITIARPGRASAAHSYQGREIKDEEVFLCGPECEVEVVNRGALYSNMMLIGKDVPENESDWLAQSPLLLATRGLTIQAPGWQWSTDFLNSLAWLVDAVQRYPRAALNPKVRASLEDQLLARVTTLGVSEISLANDRRMKAQRRKAVERAREYVARHLTEPMRLSELSKHARTQARSLEYGFQEVFGVSPMIYVRTMRLHRARDLLRSTAVRSRSVSELAMDCGFWHLSQFSADYKLLFAESPSITFRRTQAQLPRNERHVVAETSPT
jgi:AraC family transcriptional regulator, ethanolamine operon transcriptional activator